METKRLESKMGSSEITFARQRRNRTLGAAAVLFFSLLVVAGWNNRHLLNADGIAYLRIASYYAQGKTELMVSGYWGPLLSWLMVPWLKWGLEPLETARVAMGISAVIFWLGCLQVFRKLNLPYGWQGVAGCLAAAAALCWSVEYISPDLLVAGFICLATGPLMSEGWLEKRWVAPLTGVFWALAYLAKAIAFPAAFIISLAVAGLWWLLYPERRGQIGSKLGITLGTFLVLALPWILTLSVKYQHLTFSTSGKIAHAVVGPSDLDRYHPMARNFHQPAPGRITSWEDPSQMPYHYWSPLQNQRYAWHQIQLIGRNAWTTLKLLAGFDRLALGVLAILGAVLLYPSWRKALERDRWRWGVIPVLSLAALYLPVYVAEVDQRYFYAAYPFLLTALLALALRWAGQIQWRSDWTRKAILGLVCLSFIVPVLENLPFALGGTPDPPSLYARDLAQRLRKAGVSGPIAGSGLIGGGRVGMFVAFLLNEPWHGDQPQATPEQFKQSNADLIILHRDRPATAGLDEAEGIKGLDVQLFESEAEAREYPLKAYVIRRPGEP